MTITRTVRLKMQSFRNVDHKGIMPFGMVPVAFLPQIHRWGRWNTCTLVLNFIFLNNCLHILFRSRGSSLSATEDIEKLDTI